MNRNWWNLTRKLLCAVVLLCLVVSARAPKALALSTGIPDRPGEDACVLDSAGVLSESTETAIQQGSDRLFEDSGAEICVVTVDFLGGRNIDDYANDLFDRWGIGSAQRNNGLLLVLAVGEDDYYALPGYGVDDLFTGAVLQELLDENLEEDFAAGNYDAGTLKFFHAAYDLLENYDYHDAYSQENDADSTVSFSTQTGSGLRRFLRFLLVVGVLVLVLWLIFRNIRANSSGGSGYGGYSGYRGSGSGGFWRGMFWGSMLNRRRNYPGGYTGQWRNPPPPGPRPGGFGGFGGTRPTGGFNRGGSSRPSGSRPSSSRSSSSRSRPSGGFSRGGGSRGGGAGRRR